MGAMGVGWSGRLMGAVLWAVRRCCAYDRDWAAAGSTTCGGADPAYAASCAEGEHGGAAMAEEGVKPDDSFSGHIAAGGGELCAVPRLAGSYRQTGFLGLRSGCAGDHSGHLAADPRGGSAAIVSGGEIMAAQLSDAIAPRLGRQ